MYTGTYNDHMLGYYQMGARYYNAGMGRFTQQDPLGSSVFEPNRYLYTPADPVNYTDPTGLHWYHYPIMLATGDLPQRSSASWTARPWFCAH
ncbi:MAG: RHS repeat-associated core domain-containing protein [Chloroflexota bacterium]|nr:RHS repeat-associated core domain-containing protein [Chloroflexota bacterium]